MGSGRNVLLVDDEQQVLDVLSGQLQKAGFEVRAVLTGEAALEECKNDNYIPDVVVADLMLPGITGLEAASRLSLLFPALKIVLMSGYTGAEFFRHSGTSLQDVPFLQKPFAPDALVDKVRTLVETEELSSTSTDQLKQHASTIVSRRHQAQGESSDRPSSSRK